VERHLSVEKDRVKRESKAGLSDEQFTERFLEDVRNHYTEKALRTGEPAVYLRMTDESINKWLKSLTREELLQARKLFSEKVEVEWPTVGEDGLPLGQHYPTEEDTEKEVWGEQRVDKATVERVQDLEIARNITLEKLEEEIKNRRIKWLRRAGLKVD
jgi:hypothetical protein